MVKLFDRLFPEMKGHTVACDGAIEGEYRVIDEDACQSCWEEEADSDGLCEQCRSKGARA